MSDTVEPSTPNKSGSSRISELGEYLHQMGNPSLLDAFKLRAILSGNEFSRVETGSISRLRIDPQAQKLMTKTIGSGP